MLSQHAGMRDKELRTLQWNGFNLLKRIVIVGEGKMTMAPAAPFR
jgi:hypothetical protein